jgi:hypothetical protein
MREWIDALEERTRAFAVSVTKCVLWLELLRDAGAFQPDDIQRLLSEALELRAIFSKSKSTLKHKQAALR